MPDQNEKPKIGEPTNTFQFNPVAVQHVTGGVPEIIRLLDKDGKTLIDSVSATYEDSFCLDPFADLIRAHQEVNKFFIIARVQTWDKKQPDKAFYSYYNAFHLNKILFQTQMYCGKKLIHRLLVLNPLTNTDIIGDVQYFMVRTLFEDSTKKKNSAIREESVLKSNAIAMQDLKPINEAEGFIQPPLIQTGNGAGRRASAVTPDRMMFMMRKSMPPAFNSTAVSSPGSKAATPRPSPDRPDFLFIGSALLEGGNIPIRGRTRSEITQTRSELAALRPAPGGNVLRRLSVLPSNQMAAGKMKMLERRISKVKQKSDIPAGTVTQFNQPVPAECLAEVSPPTPELRRRILSMQNAVNMPVSPIKDIKTLDSVEETWQKNQIYDAILIGTDNDYLEASKMRAVFREHALAEEDVKLFEMPAFPPEGGEDSPLGDIFAYAGDINFRNRSWLYQLVGHPHPTVMETMHPCCQLFHYCKCYIVTTIVIFGFFFGIFFLLSKGSSGYGAFPSNLASARN